LTGLLPALFRVALGVLLIPVFGWSRAGGESAWSLWLFFLFVLLALRIVPAVLRHILPFSQETQRTWFARRVLAKRYDSYQWRKLLWIGLGLSAYLAVRGEAAPAQDLLATVCLVGGVLGEVAWRRVARTDPVLQSQLRQLSSSTS
jgi:hypothetical protein